MKLTTKILAAALVSGAMASSAMAQGFFVGGEAGVTTYPDYTSQANQALINAGAFFSSTTQTRGSTAIGVFGGQWVTDNFGWEVGYTDLGSITGTTTTIPAATGNYKYSASALYAAALGGVKLGAGTLYGKAGLYSASVKSDWNVSGSFIGFGSSTTSSNGLVIGGGYSMSFMRHLSGKAEFSIYNGVKFANVYNIGTRSDNITKLSVGVAYAF